MGDYQHSTTIRRDPDTVFAYLSDVENLPDYFDSMKSATSTGGEDVHVVAEVQGHRYEGEAWIHADPDAKSIRWGAGQSGAYFGELFVTGIGDVESRVTVTLHTEHHDGQDVRSGLEATLDNLGSELNDGGAGTPG